MSQYNATKDSIKVGVPYEPRPDSPGDAGG